ncbi:MAG: DUF3592 domain-containing protein [Prosthecobacter sp.]|uniref:DUF3592 domain-containing protein n=1 Tax=Prosthecobacter sp. TaxID=1965333 RepID=UPI003904295A
MNARPTTLQLLKSAHFYIIMCGVCLIVGIVCRWFQARNVELDRVGKVVPAKILSTEDAFMAHRLINVTYSFTTQEGKTHTFSERISRYTHTRLAANPAHLQVRYHPHEPAHHHIVTNESHPERVLAITDPGLILGLVMFSLLAFTRGLKPQNS